MDWKFNLNEIFEIAAQIERNGADFYRKAAVKFEGKPEIKKFFIELAIQEDKHEKTFNKILKTVLKNKSITTEDQLLTREYLDAIARQFIFNKESNESKIIADMSREKIFDLAILKEKDSIIFYLGLKNALESIHDKESIDLIIKEEQRHLIELKNYAEILQYSDDRF
jgi:rubrerythrin